MADTNETPAFRLVWHEKWFQRLLTALLVILIVWFIISPVLWLIYTLQSVLLPVLVALAAAYAVNPLVSFLERRARVPRALSAVGILAIGGGIALAAFLYIVPNLVAQVVELIRKAPSYAEQLRTWLEKHTELDVAAITEQLRQLAVSTIDKATGGSGSAGASGASAAQSAAPAAQAAAESAANGAAAAAPAASDAAQSLAAAFPHGTTEGMDLQALAQALLDWLGFGFGLITSTIGLATYLVIAGGVAAYCFFFFVWKFKPLTQWFIPYIPLDHRERTLDLVHKMDAAVSSFIRGRIIQATIIASILTIGWYFAGVPYWLLLGILGGLANLIPYAAILALPPALILTWLDASGKISAGDTTVFWVLLWPTIVYGIAQGLDGWVVEPLVQGQATNLDPLSVVLVVLIGGTAAGLLGMLIAIPVAACLKILAVEVVLPKLREMAGSPPEPET